MTETTEPQVITDVVELIDGALGTFGHRELVSSGEVTDVLLDVRSMLRSGDFTPVDPKAQSSGPRLPTAEVGKPSRN